MTPIQAELWRRIESFELDDPRAARPFSRRLAQEQRWSHAFALRAIEEYKRFLFLSAACGHPVTPSRSVDEVWHLHLLYTRSYWDILCAQVLQRPLHHDPGTGGLGDEEKHRDQYQKTLLSYERYFRVAPPADLWPANPPAKPARRTSAPTGDESDTMTALPPAAMFGGRRGAAGAWSHGGRASTAVLLVALSLIAATPAMAASGKAIALPWIFGISGAVLALGVLTILIASRQAAASHQHKHDHRRPEGGGSVGSCGGSAGNFTTTSAAAGAAHSSKGVSTTQPADSGNDGSTGGNSSGSDGAGADSGGSASSCSAGGASSCGGGGCGGD